MQLAKSVAMRAARSSSWMSASCWRATCGSSKNSTRAAAAVEDQVGELRVAAERAALQSLSSRRRRRRVLPRAVEPRRRSCRSRSAAESDDSSAKCSRANASIASLRASCATSAIASPSGRERASSVRSACERRRARARARTIRARARTSRRTAARARRIGASAPGLRETRWSGRRGRAGRSTASSARAGSSSTSIAVELDDAAFAPFGQPVDAVVAGEQSRRGERVVRAADHEQLGDAARSTIACCERRGQAAQRRVRRCRCDEARDEADAQRRDRVTSGAARHSR